MGDDTIRYQDSSKTFTDSSQIGDGGTPFHFFGVTGEVVACFFSLVINCNPRPSSIAANSKRLIVVKFFLVFIFLGDYGSSSIDQSTYI